MMTAFECKRRYPQGDPGIVPLWKDSVYELCLAPLTYPIFMVLATGQYNVTGAYAGPVRSS